MKQVWEIKRLSEIGKVYNGNSINEKVKKDNYSDLDDGFPYIATKDISYNSEINYENGIKIPFSEKNSFKIAPKNTVLICAEGGSAGRKIGFTNQEVCFGNKLFALATNKDVESRYVYYYYFSETFQKHFSVELAGIIGGVSMNKFKDLEIPLPSLTEQKRIVALLDEVFAAIAKAKSNAEQNLKNAKELFESYLQEVFENKGEGWEEKTVQQFVVEGIIFKPLDGNHGEIHPLKNDYVETGIPFIMSRDMKNGKIDDENCKFISEKLAKGLRTGFAVNDDVLLSHKGTIGSVAILQTNYKFVVLTPQITYYRIKDSSKLFNRFIYYYFLSPKFQKILNDIAQGGSTRAYIGITRQLTLPFVIAPYKVQQSIVQKLDALSNETKKLEAIYLTKINDLEELKKAVLQKAFNGKLKISNKVL